MKEEKNLLTIFLAACRWLQFLFVQLSPYSPCPCQGIPEKEKEKRKRERTKPFFFFTQKLNPPILFFPPSISLLCSSRFLHLSVLGWMNSSIQRHYYAEWGAEGRIGKRRGGWRWGKSCGCWTPCKSLPSEPFNSLYSKVKSLSGKPMSNWKYMCVTACVTVYVEVCARVRVL